jgi:hypothetical protein
MNTHRLHALTAAHVDTLKRALRIAIRHDKQTLHHDAKHMQPGVLAQARAAIRAMEQLADGLSPSAPPSLPMDAEPECIRCDPGALQPCGADCPVLPARDPLVPPFELPENDDARYDPTRYSKD